MRVTFRSMARVVAASFLLTGTSVACAEPRLEAPRDREIVEIPNEVLAATLQAEPRGDTVYLSFRVTNASDGEVELTFPTGQTFEFVVEDEGGEVWRWSGERAFTQAVRHERIEAGGTREYEADWVPAAGERGELRVRGFLTALDHRVEQESLIRIP
jgi:hypothetical protein